AIGTEIMLDLTNVGVAKIVGEADELHAFGKPLARRLLRRAEAGKKIKAEFHGFPPQPVIFLLHAPRSAQRRNLRTSHRRAMRRDHPDARARASCCRAPRDAPGSERRPATGFRCWPPPLRSHAHPAVSGPSAKEQIHGRTDRAPICPRRA